MTRAHLRANWSGVPSPTGHWIGALLPAFAMFVRYAASIVRMRLSLFSGECHTEVEPETLPEPESGIFLERKKEAAESSYGPPAATAADDDSVRAAAVDDDDDSISRVVQAANRHPTWDSDQTPNGRLQFRPEFHRPAAITRI